MIFNFVVLRISSKFIDSGEMRQNDTEKVIEPLK